ncbi:MAG: AraC family transcriptional regulator [Nitrospirota bacterium]|nr:AraC family transcriptional regulator [Nitrospirota bacterium]
MDNGLFLNSQPYSIDPEADEYSVYVSKAMELISKNFSSGITLEDLSESVRISPKYLSSLFKKEVGCGVYSVITIMRIARAKEVLASYSSIKEAAFEVGFKCPKSFSKMFRRITGESPSEYKRRLLMQ